MFMFAPRTAIRRPVTKPRVRAWPTRLGYTRAEQARPLHFFHVPYLRGKDFEHRLHASIGERLLTQRRLSLAGRAILVLRAAGSRRRGLGGLTVLHRRHGDEAAEHLLRRGLDEAAVL